MVGNNSAITDTQTTNLIVNQKNSDTLLGFVAKSLISSESWTKRPTDGNEKKNGVKNFYIYKYAGVADNENEKTAMCRIAELARSHKLKHEYILFDESGPAHMKCFTVKLVLCPGQEFSGTGPSIKKAQQAAAEVALNNTSLTFPPQRFKRDELDPLVLLNQLAYQLNISVEYKNEIIRVPNKVRQPANTLPSSLAVNSTSLTTCCPPHNQSPLLPLLPPPPIEMNALKASSNCVLPYPMGPPAIISQQCSATSTLSPSLAYGSGAQQKGFSNNKINQNRLQRKGQQQQFINNKTSSLLPLPQPLQNRNNKYFHHAQQSQLMAANCFNFPIPFQFFQQQLSLCHPYSGTQQSQRDINSSIFSPIYPYNNGALQQIVQSNHFYSLTNVFPVDAQNYCAIGVNQPVLGQQQSFGSKRHENKKDSTIPHATSKPLMVHTTTKSQFNDSGEQCQFRGANNSHRIYHTVLELSDGSKHLGVGSTKTEAKTGAATQALHHLRPILEKLQADIKRCSDTDEDNFNKMDLKNQKNLRNMCDDFNERLLLTSTNKDRQMNKLTLETNGSCNGSCTESPNLSDDTRNTSSAEAYDDSPKPNNNCNGEDLINDYKANNQSFTQNTKKRRKSVVSLIHECAFQLRMNVEFEMLMEEGEPHNRQFTVRCRLVSPKTSEVIEADGRGPSKRTAKQNVCQILYEKIKGIEKDPLYLASMIVRNNRKNIYTQSKANKRKIIVKRRSDPQYGHWINPVSRLIQVMQANNLPEPIFKLVGEQGQDRYKEFVVKVTCFDDIIEEGTGQNKKLAKRAAADAMLRRIGYMKPMPQPGKSLLKKTKNSDSVEISVFDPNECIAPPLSQLDGGLLSDDNTSNSPKIGKCIETFADVENFIKEQSIKPVESTKEMDENVPNCVQLDAISSNESRQFAKRRVTFSNEVSACPPPDDETYPAASVAPLKSEVLFVANKLRKRGRDSKKMLTVEEKELISSVAQLFLNHMNGENNDITPTLIQQNMLYQQQSDTENDTVGSSFGDFSASANAEADAAAQVLQSAKRFLDIIAKTHKFSINYSDFPKSEESSSDKQFFSLVTLGIDKPIVCSGNGNSGDEAHEDAALNAIKKLSQLNHTTQQNNTTNNTIAMKS